MIAPEHSPPPSDEPAVLLAGVSKRYGRTLAVRDLSLSVVTSVGASLVLALTLMPVILWAVVVVVVVVVAVADSVQRTA